MKYKGRELPDIDLTPYIEVAVKEFGKDLMMEPLTLEYLERIQLHINLVNYFGNKVGNSYPSHDSSKITMLLPAYRIYRKPKEERTKEENDALDVATIIHITQSSHHPEYWTDTDLTGFTRSNYTPNGIIHAEQMDVDSIIHMCADWCACSCEFGTNTPMEWFNRVNGIRWYFTPEQQDLIISTINKMWD